MGTLSVPGRIVASYELTSNPGGFLGISGSSVVEAIDTPDGVYPVTIRATGQGFSATRTFSLAFASLAVAALVNVDLNTLTNIDGNVLMGVS